MPDTTPEQRRAFDRDGYLVLEGLVDNSDIASLRLVIDERAELAGVSLLNNRSTEPSSAKRSCYVENGLWRQSGEIRQVAFDSDIPKVIAPLLDAKRLHFINDLLTAIAVGARPRVQPRRDVDRLPAQCLGRSVVALVPVDEYRHATPLTGLMRGSHLILDEHESVRTSDETIDKKGYTSSDFEWFVVKPGDVVLYDARLIRALSHDIAERTRRLFAFSYCDGEAHLDARLGSRRVSNRSHERRPEPLLGSQRHPIVYPKPWSDFPLASAYDQFAVQDSTNISLSAS